MQVRKTPLTSTKNNGYKLNLITSSKFINFVIISILNEIIITIIEILFWKFNFLIIIDKNQKFWISNVWISLTNHVASYVGFTLILYEEISILNEINTTIIEILFWLFSRAEFQPIEMPHLTRLGEMISIIFGNSQLVA